MPKRSFVQQATGRAIKFVTPVSRRDASGLVATVYAQAEREFALAPPITIFSAVPEILAGVWSSTREAFIVGKPGRVDREIVAAAVSQANACPFCVEVHGAMLHGAGRHRLADGLMNASSAQASDNPLAQWALATRTPGAPILASPPFGAGEAPQILATAILFHFINRMVNVFLEPSPSPVNTKSNLMRAVFARAFGALAGRRLIRVDAEPGKSLALLPDAELPAAFPWARGNGAVAGALARFAAAIEAAGCHAVPDSVRAVVKDAVSRWNGEDPGLAREWMDGAVAALPTAAEQAAARLCLLTALASYRVDQTIVNAYRSFEPSEARLIAATAWASLAAVKRLSGWISPSSTMKEVA